MSMTVGGSETTFADSGTAALTFANDIPPSIAAKSSPQRNNHAAASLSRAKAAGSAIRPLLWIRSVGVSNESMTDSISPRRIRRWRSLGRSPPYPIRRMLAPTLQRSARLCVFQPGGRGGTDQPGSPRRPDVERAAPPLNVGGRARFLDHLELALAARQREPGNVGVLALALDDYQLVDDALGADALDLVVTEIERRLAATLRPGDTVAHLGSETFGAVCIRIDDARDLFAVSERLQVAAHQPLDVSGRQLFPTVSLGLTLTVGDDTPQQLSRDAQAALAEARRRGPGTSELFDPALRERLMERLEIEHGLRSALQRGELLLHYQPQYDM